MNRNQKNILIWALIAAALWYAFKTYQSRKHV